jgi:serine/threonine-protein kinase
MELDDLKAAWHDLDRKLAATQAALTRLQTDRTLDRTRSALRPLVWRLVWELLKLVAAVLLLGWYLSDNIHESRFAVPGLILHALAILAILSTVWQLVLVGRLDYSAPVVDIQKRLADLRTARCQTYFWVLALAPFIGVLILTVGVRGLFGGDLYAAVGLPFVLANVAFGVVFALVTVVVAKVWAARSPESRFRNWLVDGLVGGSLVRARKHAQEAAEFAAG